MYRILKASSLLFLLLASLSTLQAQTPPTAQAQYPHSMHPVANENTMFRRTLWFRIDLRQKQNEPMFATNHELPRIIINAVREGKIKPFRNDSLQTRLSLAEFEERMIRPEAKKPDSAINMELFETGGFELEDEEEKKPVTTRTKFRVGDMYLIEFKQDLVFDRVHSRMTNDIQAISIIIPASLNPKGVEINLGSFSYRELVEQVFRDNPQAIWYNPMNQAEHRTYEDAFDMWLFSAQLVKFANPQDATIEDMTAYNSKQSLIAAQKAWYKLIEFEALLWSY